MKDRIKSRINSFSDCAALILVVTAVVGTALGTKYALSSDFGIHLERSGNTEQNLTDKLPPPSDTGEPQFPDVPDDPAVHGGQNVPESPGAHAEGSGTETTPPAADVDTTPPVITGAADKTVIIGDTVSYREGVTVSDDSGGAVELEIDSSKVDLLTAGVYELSYTARDESGNETSVTVKVTVEAPPEAPPETPPETTPGAPSGTASESPKPSTGSGSSSSSSTSSKKPWEATEEDVYALAQTVLKKILKDGQTQREKAYAIFKYVHNNIKYTGTSDKSSWIAGAYSGFTKHRGDCFTYFACAKALLTLAGIPNVDLERVGGTTRHYWQLVDVGEGYMHFDSCPHSHTTTVTFLLTETEARAFSAAIAWYRPNYYVYDYASCPVPVVGLSEEERNPTPAEPETPTEPETPAEFETPTEPERSPQA